MGNIVYLTWAEWRITNSNEVYTTIEKAKKALEQGLKEAFGDDPDYSIEKVWGEFVGVDAKVLDNGV